MSDATTTLISGWEEMKEESSTPGVSFVRISLGGNGHCIALVNAVFGAYHRITGRPEPDDLLSFMGQKVTLILCIEGTYGGGSIVAREGTIFAGSGPGGIAILPKRSRRRGFRVDPDKVLDVLPGYCTAQAQALVEQVRGHFPLLTEITQERLEQLPEWGDEDQLITLCAFGTWKMPDATATDAVQLFASYDRENDICDGGVLLIRPEIGFSEHGSCYGRQIMQNFGEVVGFQPITFKRALELCDVPFDEAYDAVVGAAMRHSALVA